MRSTHIGQQVLNQPPARQDFDRAAGHRALRDALAREGAAWADAELLACGAELGRSDWIVRGELANRHPPLLKRFDRFGRRADAFEFHPAWHECLDWLKGKGLGGATWADPRPGAHVRRAALFQLFAEVECGSLCPITMTHGAVPVLAREPALAEPWLRLLHAPDYDARALPATAKRGVLIGMGMTERQGGSDVRANTTQAVPAGDGRYRITGHKWFLSATMSDAFVVTAQAPGGLTCLLLPRLLPDGTRNALRIERDKDKLGDRANASAEVEFDDALAWRIGDEGRGIATVLEMGNHTRLDCANGSAGLMRAALAEAVHHARHRHAFGRALIEQPLMANVLADIALEVEGHVALSLHVAGCVDRESVSEDAALLRRLLTPVAKYWVCKRTPMVVAEAMEATGGNGYVEDGPMPRLFRQSPLNSIWEGAGNIMCLDVLRVLAREPRAADVLVAMLEGPAAREPAYRRALDALKNRLAGPPAAEASARELTAPNALLVQAALLLGDGTSPVAETFCASRLDTAAGHAFGTLAADTDFAAILARVGA
jgi:putative acyl-CoA dehydrogenase